MAVGQIFIEVGAWNCWGPQWLQDYYPPDLPQDWRTAYYANEFPCAGLPAGAWTAADLAAWANDLPESFSLWLECGEQQLAEPGLRSALIALGDKLAGVWVTTQANSSALRASGVRVVSAPWRPQQPGGEAVVGLYRPAVEFDLREARAAVEAFAAAPGPPRRQLLAAVAPTHLERLTELVQLLGL